ncbi:LysE family translocator [Pelagibacterium lentulum]|uniref:Lysine transporter LysE n=1 Tax=Pelagibacterium lentulum TaxID=2029865 RepID=A0A916R9F5_9HYPH|nr:LysE family translocator [Pelagibacterium lentulum]GGA47419.1 lysine transporter LysE [Pelagibacterium lentulum]
MNTALVTAFLLAAVSAFFSPGPNNLMLMTSSAKFGLGRTVPHAMGIIFGFPLMVFVVGLGLGELFVAYPQINIVMRYLAAAYFLWMAWTMLGIRIGAASGSERPMRFYEAALFQWVNPKAWAMAVSFVALFVPGGEGRMLALAALTIGCIAVGPFSATTWMVFGQGLIAFLRRTDMENLLGWILAGLMVASVILFLI